VDALDDDDLAAYGIDGPRRPGDADDARNGTDQRNSLDQAAHTEPAPESLDTRHSSPCCHGDLGTGRSCPTAS
jgi:hypothetical protein